MEQCSPCFNLREKDGGIYPGNTPPMLPSSDAVYNDMQLLAKRHAFLKLSEFGRSVMGKPLLCICAGSGQRKVFFSASHHANEWISTLVLLKFMNELFEKASADDRIGALSADSLIKRTTMYFVPLVNPDGVDLVLGKNLNAKFYEQAKKISGDYPSIPFPSGWKANIEGTDLNLQYPANWEKAKQIKFDLGFKSPAPRDFVGTAPLSAPESRAHANLTRNIDPDIVLALHSQGNVIYWKFSNREPVGAYKLGLALAKASGYELSLTPPESDNAGFKDWFIQDFDRPGYTVELGLGESPLPLSQFGAIYSAASPLLAAAANG
ncbi:MAG: M14 family metallocarboxypeptidase [Oscillospiraceae bacterium]|nr:M14 family metallocarboxypeptidase [Oscillospiraceae bacterium]